MPRPPQTNCPRCEVRFTPGVMGKNRGEALATSTEGLWMCDTCGLIFDADGNKRTFDQDTIPEWKLRLRNPRYQFKHRGQRAYKRSDRDRLL